MAQTAHLPVLQRRSPGVCEEPVDFGVSPVTCRDKEDILQPVEVALGDWVNTNQAGLQESGPLGSRERTRSPFIFLGERENRESESGREKYKVPPVHHLGWITGGCSRGVFVAGHCNNHVPL